MRLYVSACAATSLAAILILAGALSILTSGQGPGHALDAAGAPAADGAAVRIVAAMVNPPGPAPEAESVLLLNASPQPVDLSGWRIADRAGQTCPVPAGPLAAGDTRRVALAGGVALGNGGGTISLLDASGLKAAGVAYSAAAARREGWTVTF